MYQRIALAVVLLIFLVPSFYAAENEHTYTDIDFKVSVTVGPPVFPYFPPIGGIGVGSGGGRRIAPGQSTEEGIIGNETPETHLEEVVPEDTGIAALTGRASAAMSDLFIALIAAVFCIAIAWAKFGYLNRRQEKVDKATS